MKFDLNFTGLIGQSAPYAQASYATRTTIALAHRRYQEARLWLLASDPKVPSHIRDHVRSFGLAADEFTSSENWPVQALYLREGRRMVGDYVFCQRDTQRELTKPDAIARGGWFVDSHPCGLYEHDGQILVEGTLKGTITHGASNTSVFQIPYRSITPKSSQASNLWVTCCPSASHVGFDALRIEWIYMTLGEVAATAAVLSNHSKATAQQVPHGELVRRLDANGARLST